MELTAAEYAQVKEAYLQMLTGKRVVSTEVGGQQRQYFSSPVALSELKALIDEYESRNGTVPLRTYAKNGSVSC